VEVEGVVVEKVEVWEEDKGSMMTIKKSWVIQTTRKSMEEKKRVRERFKRELTMIPDLQEEEMGEAKRSSKEIDKLLKEYRNTPIKAIFTSVKGNGLLAIVHVVSAVPEAKPVHLPSSNKGLEESRWKVSRREVKETKEILAKIREDRRRLQEDLEEES